MSYTAILLLILGIVLVVGGSNYLVDGASDVARRSGISEFVIGLTIVGIGTSLPEMVVSFISAIQGSADMAIGNVIGSNIFNTCLILGITAVILPITITRSNVRTDIPVNIFASVVLIGLGLMGGGLSRLDGAFMLVCFAVYMYYCFKNGKDSATAEDSHEKQEDTKSRRSVFVPVLMIVGGLAALIFGGQLFVDNATVIARYFNLSDKVIGITVLALGTSLPELATCVAAAIKKKDQLALGNIIGSNIANILLILGGAALIRPLDTSNITVTDLGFVLLAALFPLAAYFSFDKRKLDRIEGAALLAMAAVYLYLLF